MNTRSVGTAPKGCEEWSPTAWFDRPDPSAGRVGVDHGVDGKPRLLVSTFRDDQGCEAFAVMTPSGEILTAAAFAGPVRLGAPVVGEGVVVLGVEVRVDDDEDNSSMIGVEFVGTETAVPPFLKPVSETPNWMRFAPSTVGVRMGANHTSVFDWTLKKVVALPKANDVAVVGDVVFRGTEERLEVVGADGVATPIGGVEPGDRILRLVANRRWIAWLVRRGPDLLLFASPFARTSGDFVPVLLATQPEGKSSVGDIYLGPDHLVFRAELFRLQDRARWSLEFLHAPGRGGPLQLAGLTADSLYWTDWNLRRVAYSDLGEPTGATSTETSQGAGGPSPGGPAATGAKPSESPP